MSCFEELWSLGSFVSIFYISFVAIGCLEHLCVCVCVRERERDRKSVCVKVCVCEGVYVLNDPCTHIGDCVDFVRL